MLLPTPSSRNFEIFSAVEDRGQSLRTVAEDYGISPQRVQEIVQQVNRWYAENTPQWRQELDPANRAMVAFRRHDDRMKVLYDHAMKCFEDVRNDLKASGHQSRYLASAIRISRERFKSSMELMKVRGAEDVPVGTAPQRDPPVAPPVGVLAHEDIEDREAPEVAPTGDDETPVTVESFLGRVAPNSAADSPRDLCADPWRADETPSAQPIEDSVDFNAVMAASYGARPAPPTKEAPRKTRKQERRKQHLMRKFLAAQLRDSLLEESAALKREG